jgi:hypothetical protein
MTTSYKQLTQPERYQIEALCKLDKGKITNTTILIIAKLFFGAAHYHGCPVNYLWVNNVPLCSLR